MLILGEIAISVTWPKMNFKVSRSNEDSQIVHKKHLDRFIM